MFISVVIPAYGQNSLLDRCIQRIRDFRHDRHEIIAVDDCSNPEIQLQDKGVKLIRSRSNIGPAGARNLGAQEVKKGDVILFVDSDVILENGACTEIEKAFSDQNLDALQGVYSSDFPYTDFFSKYKNLYWNFNQLFLNQSPYSVCTAIFAIRRKVFFELGGFNSVLFIGEDKDIGLRLAQKKKNVLRSREVRGVHHRKFTFFGLIKHHFQNSVVSALLLLKTKRSRLSHKGQAWAGTAQVIGLVLSPIIIFLALLTFFTWNLALLVIEVIVLVSFLCVIFDFLKYGYKRFGLRFSFASFFMYILEGNVAAAGIMTAIVRFFLKQKDLNFRVENKLHETAG